MPIFQKHFSHPEPIVYRSREVEVKSPPVLNEPSLKHTEGFIRKGLMEGDNYSRACVSVIVNGEPLIYTEFEEIKALNEELNTANEQLLIQKEKLEEALIAIRSLRKNKFKNYVKLTRNIAAITGGITALWQLVKFIIFLINGK
jgi:hypothetical protein